MKKSFQDSENNNFNNKKESNTKNDYSKYINLVNEEIIEKISENKKKIIEYHNVNKSLKSELTGILEKLNSLTDKNKFQSFPNEINLQTILNIKKMEYIKNKTNNSLLKEEYNSLLKRMKEISEKKIANLITEKKLSIDKLKEENFEIKKLIIKNQSESAKTQNEVIKIRNNNMHLQNLDLYNYRLKKYMDTKNKYIKAINKSCKMLNEKKKEVDSLENTININNKIFSNNEIVYNKLKEDLNKIKTDLSDITEEINNKNIYEDILILNNFNQKNLDSTNANTFNINNKSPDIFITKSPTLLDVHNNKIVNYYKMMNNNIKLKPILRKNNSSSLLHNNALYNSNEDIKGSLSNLKHINQIYSIKNINNNNSNSSSTLNMVERKENYFIKKNINSFSCDLNKIKFKEIDDEIYHNLLNKKENYMEESERISKNIKDINKIFFTKYNKVVNNLKKNINKLNEIKVINNGLQTEIKKLQDLMSEMQNENKKILENGGTYKNV